MLCLVTEYVAANCSVCGKPAEPVHIVGYTRTCPACTMTSACDDPPCPRCKGQGTIIEDRFFDTAHCPIKHRVNVHSTAEQVA
jgi:DnaJ-class molecular chaperone